MFGWTSETWINIGKYGLATVFACVLLGFFINTFNKQTAQIMVMQESSAAIAVSNSKVADAVDDFGKVTERLVAQTDQVGDRLESMTESNKAQLEANRRVLERIWNEQTKITGSANQ